MENDVIIVGAGMGGLSAGAFLAMEGKKVLILEKHDKPGGYVGSFARAPKPPYEMNFLEKISFGITSLFRKRTFLKYGRKHSVKVLERLFRDKTLASIIWAYYPIHSLVFLAHAFGWEMIRRDENYYPEGGLQAIPDATVKVLRKNGGEVLFNSKVERILVKDGGAVGVKCADGREYHSDIVISNAPIHHTLSKLLEKELGLEELRAEVEKREARALESRQSARALMVTLTMLTSYPPKGSVTLVLTVTFLWLSLQKTENMFVSVLFALNVFNDAGRA